MLLSSIITCISLPVLSAEENKITLNAHDQKLYDSIMGYLDKYPLLRSILISLNEQSISNKSIMKSVLYVINSIPHHLKEKDNKEFHMIIATMLLNALREYQDVYIGLIKWKIEDEYISKDKNIADKILKEYPFSFKVSVYDLDLNEINKKGLKLGAKLTTEQQNAAIRKYIDSNNIKSKSYKHNDEYEGELMCEYLNKSVTASTNFIIKQDNKIHIFELYNIQKIKSEDISEIQKHRFIAKNNECKQAIAQAIEKIQKEKDSFIKKHCLVKDESKFAKKLYTERQHEIKTIA